MNPFFNDHRNLLLVVGLLVLGAIGCFANLDSAILWQDEAQTAVIARTIFEHGVPLGTDGRNFFSQELGTEYGEGYIWKWHTWLQFYVVAASFAVFGETTWAARAPFAAFGLATIVLLWRVGRRLWGAPWPAAAGAVLLATSVPFLLLVRQSRYYSMAAFFTVLTIWAYLGLVDRRRAAGPVLALALFGLFHSHYVYIPPLVATLALHALLFHRDRLRDGALWTAVAGLACLPFAIWLASMRYADSYGAEIATEGHATESLTTFLRLVTTHVFPWALLAIPLGMLVVAIWRREPARSIGADVRSGTVLLGLAVVSHLGILALFAPAPFFRYLAPLLPLLALAAGRIVSTPLSGPWPLKGVLLVALVAWGPVGPFVDELTHDFEGPLEALVRHLDEHADPGDVVAISYGDMPLKFYTELRVVGGLTGEDLAPAHEAEWVVMRQQVVSLKGAAVQRVLRKIVRKGPYRPSVLDVVDTPWENREEPGEHLFVSATEGPKLVVHRRYVPDQSE